MNPEKIVIHHSAIDHNSLQIQCEAINNAHKKRGFPKSKKGFYTGYHYLIELSGICVQTRFNNEIGAHCRAAGMNYKSIGICLAGNFEIQNPKFIQVETLYHVLEDLRYQFGLQKEDVIMHSDVAKTLCPGENIKKHESIYKMIENKMRTIFNNSLVHDWAKGTERVSKEKGIMKDWSNAQGEINNWKIMHIFHNLGWLDNPPEEGEILTEERFIHALHKGGAF